MGITYLEVKGSECSDYYRSIRPERTEGDALKDAVDGFFAFLKGGAEIREVDDW